MARSGKATPNFVSLHHGHVWLPSSGCCYVGFMGQIFAAEVAPATREPVAAVRATPTNGQ